MHFKLSIFALLAASALLLAARPACRANDDIPRNLMPAWERGEIAPPAPERPIRTRHETAVSTGTLSPAATITPEIKASTSTALSTAAVTTPEVEVSTGTALSTAAVTELEIKASTCALSTGAAVSPGTTASTSTISTAAATAPETAASTCAPGGFIGTRIFNHSLRLADRMQDILSERYLSSADRLDRFISREKEPSTLNPSRLDVSLQYIQHEHGAVTTGDVDLQLSLPRSSGRLNLVVEHVSEDLRSSLTESNRAVDDQEKLARGQTEAGTSIGLRYIAGLNKLIQQHFDVGVNVRANFKDPLRTVLPYAKTSVSVYRTAGPAEGRIYGQGGWYAERRVEVVGGLYGALKLKPKLKLESSGNLQWKSDDAKVGLYETVSLPFVLGKNSLLTPAFQLYAVTRPATQAMAYTFSISYRHLLHDDWLWGNVTPAAGYARDNAFKLSPSLTLRLDLYFGATT